MCIIFSGISTTIVPTHYTLYDDISEGSVRTLHTYETVASQLIFVVQPYWILIQIWFMFVFYLHSMKLILKYHMIKCQFCPRSYIFTENKLIRNTYCYCQWPLEAFKGLVYVYIKYWLSLHRLQPVQKTFLGYKWKAIKLKHLKVDCREIFHSNYVLKSHKIHQNIFLG